MSDVDRVQVASFVAKQIKNSAKGQVDEQRLADAISEIELESQIEGASFIKVHLIDPYWELATSDFLTVSKEGLLDNIQVEFPEGSGWWWQLAAVELSNDVTQPNTTLVFEDRIVAWLREMSGEKTAPPGTTTRAQFVKALLDEVHLKHSGRKIVPVIPSLNVIQPVESAKPKAQEIVSEELTQKAKANEHAKINKTAAIGAGAALTVKGQPMTSGQREQANILLSVANAKGANQTATEALIFVAIAESSLTAQPANSLGYWGVLSGSNKYFKQTDSQGMAEAFLDGDSSKGFQGGGAITLSHKSHNPVEIAVRVEVPSEWPANAYASEAGYEHFLPETQAIIAAGGGVTGGTSPSSGESDVGQLQRGMNNNPDEDSFECIQRLARQVRWFAFTNGNSFFYMDGFDFIRQKPSAYIDLIGRTVKNGHSGKTTTDSVLDGLLGNFDNTSFAYYAAHKRRGRSTRKSKISKPLSPSEIRLPMVCEPTEYRAGDVFVIQNAGPLNGRWVVTDAVRKYIEDPHTTFTLEPPEEPYPEPLASKTSTSTSTEGENPEGELKSVVEAAKKALKEKSKYKYVYGAGHSPSAELFGPTPREMDCSAFAELCYKTAKQPDPAGGQYTSATNELVAHMIQTNQPQPGDLCFYGASPTETVHVTVYVGNGQCISMGSLGDPSEGPVESMGPSKFLGYWRPVA